MKIGHRISGCQGMARSSCFNCPQSDDQIPHVIFYRPPADQAIADIKKSPKRERDWLLDHYAKQTTKTTSPVRSG